MYKILKARLSALKRVILRLLATFHHIAT